MWVFAEFNWKFINISADTHWIKNNNGIIKLILYFMTTFIHFQLFLLAAGMLLTVICDNALMGLIKVRTSYKVNEKSW